MVTVLPVSLSRSLSHTHTHTYAYTHLHIHTQTHTPIHQYPHTQTDERPARTHARTHTQSTDILCHYIASNIHNICANCFISDKILNCYKRQWSLIKNPVSRIWQEGYSQYKYPVVQIHLAFDMRHCAKQSFSIMQDTEFSNWRFLLYKDICTLNSILKNQMDR